MRVSLNFYNQANFRTNFKSSYTAKPVSNNAIDTSPLKETEEADNTGLRPAVIRYPWLSTLQYEFKIDDIKSTRQEEDKQKEPDYDANLDELNKYVINTSAYEEFDGYPSTYEDLCKDYKNFNLAIATLETPRDLVQYYTNYINKVLRFSPKGNEVTRDLTNMLNYKIDFEALGVDDGGLSLRDLVRYAALFDFWSITPDGEPRNGYVRPDFVRSPKEYVEKLSKDQRTCIGLPPDELRRLTARFIPEILEKDAEIQKALNAEYSKMLKERGEYPKARRGYEPNRLLSPLNRFRAVINHRSAFHERERDAREAERARAEREPAYDPNLDMAKVWHDFLGGDLD